MSAYSTFAAGGALPWVSGTTYAAGDVVVSPADNYLQYVRVIAGAGATDPSSDSTNWKPFGGRTIKSIQRGTISLSSGTSATATITSVVTGKSVVRFLGYHSGTSNDLLGTNVPRLDLSSATTVRATIGATASETFTISFEVTEYY